MTDVPVDPRPGTSVGRVLRPGNAAANSGAEQLAVVDLAIVQLPTDVAVGHRPELVLVQLGRYVAPPNESPIHGFRSYLYVA